MQVDEASGWSYGDRGILFGGRGISHRCRCDNSGCAGGDFHEERRAAHVWTGTGRAFHDAAGGRCMGLPGMGIISCAQLGTLDGDVRVRSGHRRCRSRSFVRAGHSGDDLAEWRGDYVAGGGDLVFAAGASSG